MRRKKIKVRHKIIVPYYEEENITIYHEDCLEIMPQLKPESIDAIVTDPPYGLKMNKEWDHGIPGVPFWKEALRIAKPGCHLLAFGGTRTHHRLMCAIEDAGWEIRDCLGWLYGSGFPKSLDVSKALDKMAGVEREVVGHKGGRYNSPGTDIRGGNYIGGKPGTMMNLGNITIPATPSAIQWEGFGIALKPVWEPIILARKPLDGTVTNNVLKWGVGGLNIDECRIKAKDQNVLDAAVKRIIGNDAVGWKNTSTKGIQPILKQGRFPANLIHDGSDEVMAVFPNTKSGGKSKSASRFFYCTKASRSERGKNNNHLTVKPLALMRYLCRLVTPPSGVVIDMFMGSGSTGITCKNLNRKFIGIELDKEYCEIVVKRLKESKYRVEKGIRKFF